MQDQPSGHQTGQLVGNYRIVRKLGEGGMGVVYEGIHEQIGRRVAIKMLHPDLSRHADTVSRFLTEARLVSRLQHPGVVYTFEYGQLPDQTAYIVMEYLQGESLATRLKASGGRLGGTAVNVARQIASALATAHEQGIVHRDLKPDNVMIVADAEAIGGERAKILDFGIAKAQGTTEGSGAVAVKTQTGALMGTPRYMSPEQCRGVGEVTGKSDVYSLGVMLYELVGGRPPMVAEGAGELIAMHLYVVPKPLRELDPSLPTELTQLVDAMLAKNPDDRPPMTQVVKQLEQLAAARSMPPTAGPLPASALAGLDKVPAVSPSWPEVVAGMLATPTTLRAAAAKAAPEQPVARRAISPIGWVVLGVVGLAAIVSVQWVRRPPSEPPRAAAPPATAHAPAAALPKVHWQVTSQPPGAQVVRVSDHQVLGTTPWHSELPAGPDKVQLLLRLPGFADKSLELSQNTDADRKEALSPTAPAAGPEPRSRGKRRGAAKSLPAGKSTSEEISDDELRIVK